MPVRLEQLPPLAPRPAQPRFWLWLAALPLLLLLGVVLTLLLGNEVLRQDIRQFCSIALGVPLLGWSALSFVRAMVFMGQQRVAEGWDQARESDWASQVRRGRRSQQVLGVSLHTALREREDRTGVAQLAALLSGTQALKAQPCRQGEQATRHSCLNSDKASPEALVLEAFEQVLADLKPTLAQLPETTPLALLLEADSGVPEGLMQRAWRQAWAACGIHQSIEAVQGSGLAALDQWLDQRITDQALLMVVALQVAPHTYEGRAEVAVGLLLGNRLTQKTLAPMAYLHRPEQAREAAATPLLHAARQALDWVPLPAQAIERTWCAGLAEQCDAALGPVLSEASLPAKHNQGLCHLDALLGQAGQASPWLAIAAAAQTIAEGAGPQFIFSGNSSAEAQLWCTVLMPVPPLSK
jgi:hypothetical protein